jgi:hypothetical protein
MEIISNVDIENRAYDTEVEGFRYIVPSNSSRLVVVKQQRHTGKQEVKHNKVSKESETRSPFGNWMTITLKEIHIIREMIHYIDSRSTLALGLPSNQKHLKDEGKKIAHVHPLCFIWAIVTHPELKNKLRDFRDNSAFALKWNGFLGYSSFHDKGFGRNMEKYYNHRDPEDYLNEFEAFYHCLGLKSEEMNVFAASKNWADFASALLDESSYR